MKTEKGTTIFLIDDDEFLLDMYSLKFKEAGFKIEVASSGEEALQKLKEGLRPEVILLDIVMPKMDGFEFLQKAYKEKLLDKSIVVVLSNLGQKEDVEKGNELGVSDYIIKASFTPSEVVRKVESLLENKKDNKKEGNKLIYE